MAQALPAAVRTLSFDAGSCGRFETAVALLHGLVIVEALGQATGIDPGRPKAGNFAEALYNAPTLVAVSGSLASGVRAKAAAMRERDHPSRRDLDLVSAAARFRSTLARCAFRGLVLDYDGTLVTLEGRYEPMSSDLAAELNRLLDEGLALAVATGRGASAGEQLRCVIPERHWDQVVVSYYNGSHTQPLRADLDSQRPASDPRLEPARAWLARSGALKPGRQFHDSHVQLTIEISDLADEAMIKRDFAAEGNPDGALRLAWSSHTVDICLVEACKTTAAAILAVHCQVLVDNILCIGDSGSLAGNDHALLGLPCGVSVGRVCDRPEAAWNLFDNRLVGPDAVLTILRALRPGIDGHRLWVDDLEAPGVGATK
jgi:hypothetical protein